MPLGDAVYKAMTSAEHIKTQENLAIALDVDQTTISRLIRGARKTSLLDFLARVEEACDLPRGQILAWAGYVDAPAAAPAEVIPITRTQGARQPASRAAKGGSSRVTKRGTSTRPATGATPEEPTPP